MKTNMLIVGILGLAFASNAMAATIFEDDFNRSSSNTVGNSWTEIENDNNDVAIISGSYLQLRDEVRGNPDAAVTRSISTAGYDSLQLSFQWMPLNRSESSDDLLLSWSTDASSWTDIFFSAGVNALGLGGNGYSDEGEHGGSINNNYWVTTIIGSDYLSSLNDLSSFYLRLWTDVSNDDEGALINYISLTGSLIPQPEPPTNNAPILGLQILSVQSVPEPSELTLLVLGVLAMTSVMRKNAERKI